MGQMKNLLIDAEDNPVQCTSCGETVPADAVLRGADECEYCWYMRIQGFEA